MKDQKYFASLSALTLAVLFSLTPAFAQSIPTLPAASALAANSANTPSVASVNPNEIPPVPTAGNVPGVVGPVSVDTPKDTTPKSLAGVTLPAPPPSTTFTSDSAAITKAQADLQAETQAEAEKQKQDDDRSRRAFERAAGALFPMSSDQIKEFMRRLEDTDNASRPFSYGTPKADVRVATLSLDPGSAPPQVNLQVGYVTTINIMDATGEPWPILDVGVGGNFEVSPTRAGSQVVRVMPLAANAEGNISVLLKDLSTPVIFRLSTNSHAVDMRYDARIPKFGPNAKIPLIDRPRLEAGNEEILMLLQNAPPHDAQRIKVSGLDARTMAWSLNGHTYVRTPLTLLSPAWDASVSSDDGMTVYQIGDAPVLLMSDNGAMVRAKLMRDSDHDR